MTLEADLTLPLWDEDEPRARRTDPLTSHIAADVSQPGLAEAKRRVLQLLDEYPRSSGSELNETYQGEWIRRGWKRLSWDSPRKRAGELEKSGHIEVVDTAIVEGHIAPESIYDLTSKGLEAARSGK